MAFRPSDLSGLKIWLDASQLGLADGATINTWPSLADPFLVGTNFNTAPYRPTLRAAALNGLPVARFIAGSGMRWSGFGLEGEAGLNWTCAFVGRTWGGPGRVVTAGYPPTNILIGWHSGNEDKAFVEGWLYPDVGHAQTTSWKLYTAAQEGVIGSTKAWFYSDGVFLSGDHTVTGGWNGSSFHLNGYAPTSGEETCDCEIAEVVLYDHKLSDAERQQVEGYLRSKWITVVAAGPTQSVQIGGVPPAGTQPHIVGSSLSGQRTVGFYPGVPAFGAVTISTVYRVGPTSLGSAGAFGAVTARTTITRTVGAVASAQSFGTAVAKSTIAVPVTGLPQTAAFGTPSTYSVYRIAASGLGSAQSFGTPTPRTGFVRSVPGLPSAQSFGSLKIVQTVRPAGLNHGLLDYHIVGEHLSGEQVVGFTGEYLFGRPGILAFVQVGGVPSAQQFGGLNVRQYVQIPGLNHGLLHYHIVGSYLAGEALVGFYGEFLFGRPTIRIAFPVAGIPSAQEFGQILLGTQHLVPGVPSAQQFGVPWIAFEQFQPVPGLGTAQSFGLPLVYRVWFRPPRPPDEISLTPISCNSVTLTLVACADTLLVPAAWTEETLPPSDEQDLALVPSVEE